MTDYEAYRMHAGISNIDMTALLHEHYPRYNKVVAVGVNHPDTHGVCLLPEAEQILVSTYGEGPGLHSIPYTGAPAKKRQDRRRKKHRFTCRLDDDMMQKAELLREASGAMSWQELFEIMLREAYRRWEES